MLERPVACCIGLLLLCACKGRSEALPVAQAATLAPAVSAAAPAVAPSAVVPSVVAPAATSSAPVPVVRRTSRCNEQAAQDSLKAAHFDSHYAVDGEQGAWAKILSAAVRYRTEQYGYVEGFGNRAWNPRSAWEQGVAVTFFEVPVIIHQRVAPALACVETAIRERCSEHPYKPTVLSGMRRRNTYANGEVSNHVYGIAIDVDPTLNPCCGCLSPWRDNPRCQNDRTKFERMDMPRCWIEEFERFGFYWLGNDRIEDTMHFEFLADPKHILSR
ncbi:MAG: M15 family metallopeptidase [Polyangiaceae bacterium]